MSGGQPPRQREAKDCQGLRPVLLALTLLAPGTNAMKLTNDGRSRCDGGGAERGLDEDGVGGGGRVWGEGGRYVLSGTRHKSIKPQTPASSFTLGTTT